MKMSNAIANAGVTGKVACDIGGSGPKANRWVWAVGVPLEAVVVGMVVGADCLARKARWECSAIKGSFFLAGAQGGFAELEDLHCLSTVVVSVGEFLCRHVGVGESRYEAGAKEDAIYYRGYYPRYYPGYRDG